MGNDRVLLVDDDELLLAGLQRKLSKQYQVTAMSSSSEALNLLAQVNQEFSVAVVDYKMPIIDGIQFCSLAKELKPEMPCILLSGHMDVASLHEAVNVGKVSYVLAKPCPEDKLHSMVSHFVNTYNKSLVKRRRLLDELKQSEQRMLAFESRLNESMIRIDQTNIDSLSALGLIIAGKSKKLYNHGRMTGNLAKAIAEEIQLSKADKNCLWWAGVVHEIGQAISGKTEEVDLVGGEYNEYLRLSYITVSAVNLSWPVADIIYQHRERMNGSGYPLGLKGAEIKLMSGILGIADYLISYAQINENAECYHFDKALETLLIEKAGLFDDDVVDCCINVVTRENFPELLRPTYAYN